MKRKLAVLLALCLLMQCIGVTAFASDAEVTVEAAQAAVAAAEADAAQAAEAAAAAAQAAEAAKAEADQKAAAKDAAAGEADAAKQALETAQAGAAEAAAVAAAAQEALNAAKAEQEAAAQAAADAADAAAQKAAELEAAQGAAEAAKAEAESAANQAAELSAAAENAAAAKTAAEEALAAAQAAAAAEDATEEQQAAAGAAAEAAAQAAAQADAAAQQAAEAANAAGQKAEALTAAQQAAEAAQQALDEAAAAKETAAAASDAAAQKVTDTEAQAGIAADAKSAADAAVADAQAAADEKAAALTAAAEAADQAAAALTAAQDEAAQKAQASTDAAAAVTAAQAVLTEAQAAAEAAKEQNQEPENPQEDENENVTPADGDPEQNPDDPEQTPDDPEQTPENPDQNLENPDENPDDPTADPEGLEGEGDSEEDSEKPAFAPHLVLIPAGKAIYEAETCYTREGHELLEDAIAYAEEAADEEGLVWKVTYAAEGELKTGYVRAEDAGDAEPLEETGDAVAYGEIWLPNLKMNPTPDEVKKAEDAEEEAEDAEEKPETVEEKPETEEEKPVTAEEKAEETEKKEEPVEVKAEDAEKKADDAEKKTDEKADAKTDEKADAKTDEKADAKTDEKADAKTDEKADAKTDEKAALTEEEKAAAEAEALAAAADTELLTEASESTDKDFYITPAGVITEYKGTATDIVIPVSVNGITVVGIAESAFKLNTKITSMLLHQAVGLAYIEKGSFEGCTALKSVSLPNSIVDLDDYLFKGCTSLSAISWPDNLTYIGDHTFEGCTSLPAVVLPATVNYIGNSAFEGCTGIVKVALDNLTSIQIGSSAFRGCTKLAGIYLPNGVWDVGNAAFENCTAATVLSLPSNPSFTEIKNFTFKGCTGLKEIIIPANVSVIGREAFANCSNVTRVDIPAGVTNVGSYAFNGLNSSVVFFIEAKDATLGTDAFGNSGTILAWVNSAEHKYAIAHKMTFVSMAIVYYVQQFYKHLYNRAPDRPGLVGYSTALAQGSMTVCDVIGQMLSNTEYTRRNLSIPNAVNEQFWAMLNRAPSGDELSNAQVKMENGVTIRYIGNEIANSNEFVNLCSVYGVLPGTIPVLEYRDVNYNVTSFVARAYKNILGRVYDVPGLNDWTGLLLNGSATGADIMLGFVRSREFSLLGLSNKETVRRMYTTMLNREPDPAGWDAWTQVLVDGGSVEAIVRGFVGSFEFRTLCSNYGINPGTVVLSQPRDQNLKVTAFVKRCYTEGLERGYDPKGLNDWTNVLLTKQATPAQVAYGFVFSEEAVLKGLSNKDFVRMLYRLYLGRTADPQGLNDWTQILDSGMSRPAMVNIFATSIEFGLICQSFGLTN